MAFYLLMSDFNGKSAFALEKEALKKSLELGIEANLFPENGLHPQFHMALADKFLSESNDTMVVSHSENLLLRVLRRIRLGEYSNIDLKLLILCPYINTPKSGFYWKKIDICEEGEFIDQVPGGLFEQGYRERFDVDELPSLKSL